MVQCHYKVDCVVSHVAISLAEARKVWGPVAQIVLTDSGVKTVSSFTLTKTKNISDYFRKTMISKKKYSNTQSETK